MNKITYRAAVIGVSAGGLEALSILLPQLPSDFPLAIIVVCHRLQTPDTYLTQHLAMLCPLPVQDVEHLELIQPSTIYIAPPGYHVLIDDNMSFNLSVDPPINSSRPSIDVTFETAAAVFKEQLIGIILTGANHDGAEGLKNIKMKCGYTIVQDPLTAYVSTMPEAAIKNTSVDYIGTLDEIAQHLCHLSHVKVSPHG